MKKPKKLPLFKIIVILLLIWILLVAYSAKNLSEKAWKAAEKAQSNSSQAVDYAQDSLKQSENNENLIKDICSELDIVCVGKLWR